jgi:tripartite-type tricarboxylate transporter receptor subunit TctC
MSSRKLSFLVLACLLLATVQRAFAQQYPSRPVTIIVPFAAGGPTDTLARILGQRMTVTLGQSIIIENVTGASGSIAVGRVARSSPDGYTLGIGHIGTHVFNGVMLSLQYDLLKDLEPIATVASNPQLVLSKPEIPANTLQELIAWIKARPGAILIGTAGSGSAAHVSGVYLAKTLGISATMVPYRGSAPALQALMAGQIDILFDQVSNCLPQVTAKTVKAYAVTAKNSLAAAPDIPTVDGAGLPGLYMAVWHGFGGCYHKTQCGRCRCAGGFKCPGKTGRTGSGDSRARSADSTGPRRPPESRDREMVANHQGGEHQGRVSGQAPCRFVSAFWGTLGEEFST